MIKTKKPFDRGNTGRFFFCFLVYYAAFLVLSPRVNAQELPFVHFTSEREINPLPSSDLSELYQDRLGFMWIGMSAAGLVRYDGRVMEHFTSRDGLPSETITDLTEDRLGRLWVATGNGLAVSQKSLAEYRFGERIRFQVTVGTVHLVNTWMNPNRLVVDRSGIVWAGTDEHGIIRYHVTGNTVRSDTIATDVTGDGQSDPVYSLIARRDGSVWAGLGDGELILFPEGSSRFKKAEYTGERLTTTVTAMYEETGGRLWGGSFSGALWKMDGKEGSYTVTFEPERLTEWITSIGQSKDGLVWVASQGAGLLRFSPTSREPARLLKRRNGLLSDFINALLIDREGNLWFAQNQGLSRLRANYRAFTYYTDVSHAGEQPVLPGVPVNSILPGTSLSEAPGIWVGTATGIAYIHPQEEPVYLQRDQGLAGMETYSVAAGQDGYLWIGLNGQTSAIQFTQGNTPFASVNHSIVRAGGPLNQRRLIRTSLSNVYTIRRFPIRKNRNSTETVESLWFTSYLKVACLVENEWYVFRQPAGFPATSSGIATFDDRGYLWVGTDDMGLYRSIDSISLEYLKSLPFTKGQGMGERVIDRLVFKPILTIETGAISNSIQALVSTGNHLWIGTSSGLQVIDGTTLKTVARLTEGAMLADDNVVSMAYASRTRTIWAGTGGGLVEIDPATRQIKRSLTKRDGLLDDHVAFHGSVAVGTDGAVYYGSLKGLTVYHPDLDQPVAYHPPLYVRNVHFSQTAWGRNEFRIEYAALSFASEGKVLYKTRLLGESDEWSEDTQESTARLTNLSAFLFSKRYTFQVLAHSADGTWAVGPLDYSFTVQPAWWMTWWFGLFLALGFTGVGAVGRGFRVRQLKRQEQELHKLIRERTNSLQQEKEKAERLYHQLEADNARKTYELNEARTLQLSLMPQEPPQFDDLKIAVFTSTASEVGGDYFDFFEETDGELMIALGDATGHGMKAGIVVATTKSYFQTLSGRHEGPSILRRISAGLRGMSLQGVYMSLMLLTYTPGKIRTIVAGMPPLMLYRQRTKQVDEIVIKGLPLGTHVDFPYQYHDLTVEPGDLLLLMTDGLPELFDANREILGNDPIRECLQKHACEGAEAVIRALRVLADDWRGDQPQNDDITLMALEFVEKSS